MYDGDSFFTLSLWGRAGLVALSTALGLIWIWFAFLLRRLPRISAAVGTFGLLWCFASLSPQLYYAYYRLLFDGLPQQWVVQMAAPSFLWESLTFTGRATLSAHSFGALGWAMLAIAVLWPRRDAAS